ncbi:MAG TPA: hypothetical protein VMB03_27805 [Bryobacteraceae bacterium]|nr:hypothetical protein [Bryobacteraceae bacterium]
MKTLFIRTAVLTACLLPLVAVPQPCAAQDANRDTIMTPTDVGTVVDRVEKQTGTFKDEFDRAVSHSMIDGKRVEEDSKHRADDLHNSAAKLGDIFHDKRDKNNPEVRNQVDRTLNEASQLNQVMMQYRFTDRVQREWGQLRAELNGLAAMYQLTPLPGK